MKPWITLIFALSLISISPVRAEAELERTQLAGLVEEIDFLLQRVETIRTDAPDQRRVRFRYDDLAQDLRLMRSGIAEYIQADLRAGRSIQPLTGRYR